MGITKCKLCGCPKTPYNTDQYNHKKHVYYRTCCRECTETIKGKYHPIHKTFTWPKTKKDKSMMKLSHDSGDANIYINYLEGKL